MRSIFTATIVGFISISPTVSKDTNQTMVYGQSHPRPHTPARVPAGTRVYQPKTQYIKPYSHRNGSTVRGYYRSSPRR